MSRLEIQQQEEQKEEQEKGCLTVMANPLDHGHGKNRNFLQTGNVEQGSMFYWKGANQASSPEAGH